MKVIPKAKTTWYCAGCGHKEPKWIGSCPSCHEWNTFSQEVEEISRFAVEIPSERKAIPLGKVKQGESRRIQMGMPEVDRLLGGGVVPGALLLIAGDPGIGKSTLLLQMAEALGSCGFTVLYVCGEESIEQTSNRAKRIGVGSENVFLFSETNFSLIQKQIEEIKPQFLIIDSIQILYKNEIPSAPGSVVQVRELATEFMRIAKGKEITTFLVGHVTKSGEIAGPRVLEHIVDTVLDFEGDRQQGYRILRAVKNRFGPTDEIALFRMEGSGMKEVASPSEVFLQERMRGLAGSVVVPALEGSRAILVEVQALAVTSSFAASSRKSAGLDQNRLALLLAVLEKKIGYTLHHTDVFVSIAGGIKIAEPGIDLAVLLAIASSFCNKPISSDLVVIGEVGLGGEVRAAMRIESRIKEAIQMGFRACILPKKSKKGIAAALSEKIELIGVDLVEEAVRVALQGTNQR